MARILFNLHPSQMKEVLAAKVKRLSSFHLAGQHDQKSHGSWAGGLGDEPGSGDAVGVYNSLKGHAVAGGWTGTDEEFKSYVDAVRTIRRGNIAATLSGATGHPVTVTPIQATAYGRGGATGGFAEEGSPWIGKPGEGSLPPQHWITQAELRDKNGPVLNKFGSPFNGSAKDKVTKDQKKLVVMNGDKVLDPWTHHAVYRAAQSGFSDESLKRLVDAIKTQVPMEIEKRSDQKWNNRIFVLKELPNMAVSVVIDNSKKGKIATIFIENLTAAEYGTADGNSAVARDTLKSPYVVMKWNEFERNGGR